MCLHVCMNIPFGDSALPSSLAVPGGPARRGPAAAPAVKSLGCVIGHAACMHADRARADPDRARAGRASAPSDPCCVHAALSAFVASSDRSRGTSGGCVPDPYCHFSGLCGAVNLPCHPAVKPKSYCMGEIEWMPIR